MAHMIPPTPKEFNPKSDEGKVFNALKLLPDDYYVFHSVVVKEIVDKNKHEKEIREREIDFVVANRKKGILFIEAKNGNNIKYRNRTWYYSSGKIMPHGGPYHQAETAKYAFMDKLKNHDNEDIKNIYYNCKFFYTVWFFDMDRPLFEEMNCQAGLPEDIVIDLTMFSKDLLDPLNAIEKIFRIQVPVSSDGSSSKTVTTMLSEAQFKMLLDDVFCPEFNLIPSPQCKSIMLEQQMVQLLYEQYRLLDFLEDQNTAVINGAAGTGKTMLAVEKARRNSIEQEKVLFLCYNRLLCDHLNHDWKQNSNKELRTQFSNVDFMTVHQLTQKITGNYKDVDGLLTWLFECLDEPERFGYQHVIIDEGQDFGLLDNDPDNNDAETNSSLFDTLQEVVLSAGGTFYVFYDKYQMIQGGGNIKYKLLSCIENSDCRLSLHYNCRNTQEIASTSVTPLKDYKNKAIRPKTACSWYAPVPPTMHLVGSEKKIRNALNTVLDSYLEKAVNDVVILVQGPAEYSAIAEYLTPGTGVNNGYFLYPYHNVEFRVSTCIKFKGLEADAIVLIGLNKGSFVGQKGLEFYVGTSRAKQYLDFIAMLKQEEYSDVIHALSPDAPTPKNQPVVLRNILAEIFSAVVTTQ